MANLTAAEFHALKKAILDIPQNDKKALDKIRETLVDKSPDANALKLCELFNIAVATRLTDSNPQYLIDIEHVKNLIQLRKVSIYVQSIIKDTEQLMPQKLYLHQTDLSMLADAEAIVYDQKEEIKRQFYAMYFNYDILSHLINVDDSYESRLIDIDIPSHLLQEKSKELKDSPLH